MNENLKFRRVSSVAHNRLTKTKRYKATVAKMAQWGYSERSVKGAIKKEVLEGRFLDFDDFCERHTGIRGAFRGMKKN